MRRLGFGVISGAAGGGIAVAPDNANQLADAIRRLSDTPNLREEMRNRVHHHMRAHFDRNALAGYYVDVLKDVAAAPT